MPQGPPPRDPEASLFGCLIAVAIIVGALVMFVPPVRNLLPDFGSSEGAPAVPPGGSFDEAEARRTYPGDDAEKAAIAKWMGAWAERAGLPRELPVMAALVESGLTNHQVMLDHDSLGYFQMRKSIYADSYPRYWERPEVQLKWFIAAAAQFKKPHFDDERNWGEWCADIERPAAQYRGRYQPRLPEARRLLS